MTVILEKVEYFRLKKLPSLEQYLVRRKLQEVSAKARDVKGVTTFKGQLMPKSAKIVKQGMINSNADSIKEEHPEWIKDYPEYIKELKKDFEESIKK